MKNLNLIILITLLFTACAEKSSTPQVIPVPMETPQALVTKAVTALKTVDKQAFLECVTASGKECEYLNELLKLGEINLAFRSSFIKTYGKEAWIAFLDPEQKSDDRADMTINFVTAEDVDRAQQWEPVGDEPAFRFPNIKKRESRLSKLESGWIFQFSEIFGNLSKKSLSQSIKMFQAMRDLTFKYSLVIGTEGVSPEDIDSQMGKDMMLALFGVALDVPDRFDVEEVIKQNQ